MKNSQKGSIVPVLLAIIAILIIAGGVYIYENNKSLVANNEMQQSNTQNPASMNQQGSKNSSNGVVTGGVIDSSISVSGMQEYSDPEVGFSFWYPSNWKITRNAPDQKSDANITEGTVISSIALGPVDNNGNENPQIYIQEVHSAGAAITDTFGASMNPRYYFDFSAHTWMTEKHDYNFSPAHVSIVPADVSNNTMGGLHMLGEIDQKDGLNTIVPLSAQDFLVVNKIGNADWTALTKTVMPLDQNIAVPMSIEQQRLVVQDEANAYKVLPGVSWKQYNDPRTGITFLYPTPGNFALGHADLTDPQVFVTSTGANIDSNGCYTANSPNPYQTGKQLTINGMSFCLSTTGDAGMSQQYNTYAYTTHMNGEYITLQYPIHTSNGCGVIIGQPNYVSCQYFFNNYDMFVTQPIQKSAGSLKLTH